jgi:hypothetical protein
MVEMVLPIYSKPSVSVKPRPRMSSERVSRRVSMSAKEQHKRSTKVTTHPQAFCTEVLDFHAGQSEEDTLRHDGMQITT